MPMKPTAGPEDSGTTEEPYTVHKERGDQGGHQYLRFENCGREVIGDEFFVIH